MSKIGRWILLFVAIRCFMNDSCYTYEDYYDSSICTRIERYNKTYAVPVRKRVKESYLGLCFSYPIRCTKFRWKNVTTNENVTVAETRTSYYCCKGYEQVDESCVPHCSFGCGHGECTKPDVCVCDSGWKQPYCTSACDSNRYGKNCQNNCTCLNGGTCDRKDGSCYCPDGYVGTYCERTCPYKTYGKYCRQKCQCKNGAKCHIKDGSCDCMPGYTGTYCEKPCEHGRHGKNCSKECVCLAEFTHHCYHETGECVCKAGYEGESCEKECDNFTYGHLCELKCDCVNAEFCDNVNGTCFCKPRWTGSRCSERNWEPNCTKEYQCLLNEECNPTSGNCSCSPGWIQPNCSQPCDPGSYGYNCSIPCTCLDGNSCNATTGSCYNPDYGQYQASVSFMAPLIIITSLLILSCVILVIWRYRQSETSSIWVYFSENKLTSQNSGVSTDKIIPENFFNPLYENSGTSQKPDCITENIQHSWQNDSLPATELKEVNSQIEVASLKEVDEKYSQIYEDVSEMDKINKKLSGLKIVEHLKDVTMSYLDRKSKRTSNSDSTGTPASAVGTSEGGLVEEVLEDFKIPEDDTYQDAVYERQNFQNASKEVRSQK